MDPGPAGTSQAPSCFRNTAPSPCTVLPGQVIERTLVGELRQLLRHPLPRAVLPANEQDLRNRREVRLAVLDRRIETTGCTPSLTLSPLGESGLDANSIFCSTSGVSDSGTIAVLSAHCVLVSKRESRALGSRRSKAKGLGLNTPPPSATQ